MRQNFNVGQEIIYQDLNKLSSRLERQFYDRIFSQLLQEKKDAFFGLGLKVIFTGALTASVTKGFGLQEVLSAPAEEPTIQPVYKSANAALVFETPDVSNPRIDIVIVKSDLVDGLTESRKFKDEFSGVITNQNMVINKDWDADIQIVKGTPAASPVAPAVTAGYIILSECLITTSVGMVNQGSITDKRAPLPQAGYVGDTGSPEYTAITGTLGDIGVTHSSLKSALDNASAGARILVTEDEAITAIPQVNVNNVEIIFMPGVTISKNGVASGLQISANDCVLRNARFLDFSTAGDEGVLIDSGALRTFIDGVRFNNCFTNITDAGTDTYVPVEFQE